MRLRSLVDWLAARWLKGKGSAEEGKEERVILRYTHGVILMRLGWGSRAAPSQLRWDQHGQHFSRGMFPQGTQMEVMPLLSLRAFSNMVLCRLRVAESRLQIADGCGSFCLSSSSVDTWWQCQMPCGMSICFCRSFEAPSPWSRSRLCAYLRRSVPWRWVLLWRCSDRQFIDDEWQSSVTGYMLVDAHLQGEMATNGNTVSAWWKGYHIKQCLIPCYRYCMMSRSRRTSKSII